MDTNDILKKLQNVNDSFFITIINGEKKPVNVFGTQIAFDLIPILYEILEKNKKMEKISLIIRSNGGAVEAPLPIISLIKEYCDLLDVYIPENAYSAATLLALAGNEIVMSSRGFLSPIDPQLSIKTIDKNTSGIFSVEDVNGYYKLLDKLKIEGDSKVKALEFLTNVINPVQLGQIERVRNLIQLIAQNILESSGVYEEDGTKDKIIKLLTGDIPSHKYFISRKEAKEKLQLKVRKENDEEHALIKDLMDKYKEKLHEKETEFILDFKKEENKGNTIEKTFLRGFVETVNDTYAFSTDYIFHRNGQIDKKINEWKKIK